RQRGILGGHAAAVIGDLDETSPAIDQFNVNTRAASIEGIVEEFLQYRSGALDNFSSRDAARRGRIEPLNACHYAETSRFPTSVRACCCSSWSSERACKGVIWQIASPSSCCARTVAVFSVSILAKVLLRSSRCRLDPGIPGSKEAAWRLFRFVQRKMERFRIGVGFNDEATLSNQPPFPQSKKP